LKKGTNSSIVTDVIVESKRELPENFSFASGKEPLVWCVSCVSVGVSQYMVFWTAFYRRLVKQR